MQTLLADYKLRVARFGQQLEEDSKQAREREAEVTRAERRAGRFDLGEALLQIGVVMASITLLTKRSFYVLVALALGAGGLIAAAGALLIR